MTHTCTAYKRPTTKQKTYISESEGLEKKYSKQTGEIKSRGSDTYIQQNRLQNKGHKKRCRRTLHNTQGKNPSRRHKHHKHVCTQHGSTQIYKENPGGLQERY